MTTGDSDYSHDTFNFRFELGLFGPVYMCWRTGSEGRLDLDCGHAAFSQHEDDDLM